MQLPLPAWDPNDPPPENNQVHTTPPPGWPPSKRDILFFRGDFNGVTLPGTWTTSPGGFTITSGRWNGLFIPFINGANTTPPTMIMTPMLSVYWAMGCTKLVDAVLTEHAERNYTHFISSGSTPWENPPISIAQAIAFGQMIKSWGFYNVIWQGDPTFTQDWGPLVDAGVCDFGVIGEEIDSKIIAEAYPPILNALRAGPLNGIPAGAHFTAGPKGGYPIGPQRDTFLAGGATGSWADYNGWLHLMLQSNQDQTAGTQGACTVYARQRVNLGGDGGDGRPAPNSLVIIFETMATAQLYGHCTEEYGCLRSLEMLYCPATDPGMPLFGGSANGLRYPDGSWV